MDVQIRFANEQDIDAVSMLVRAYHEFEHIDSTEIGRVAAVRELLADKSLGGIWLIYSRQALAGYIALCRGYSIEFGGFDAFVDEFYLDPACRGQGIGKRVLELIKPAAVSLKIKALHLEVARSNSRARRLYAGAGFEAREKYVLMSAILQS